MPKENKKPGARRIIVICAVLAVLAVVILVIALNAGSIAKLLGQNNTLAVKPAEGEAIIAALNVGQSNCTVIIAGDSVVMIDSGDANAAPEILSFMNAYGINRIDYLIMTHPHTDHIGSMSEVIRHAKIGELLFVPITGQLTPTNYTYYELIQTISNRNINMRAVTEGETIPLNLGQLRIIAADGTRDSLNNCSMVVSYEIGSMRAMFMGDAEKAVEYAILDSGADIKSDILFVGHHGSYTSSYRDFINAVKPKYAVISCGANNSYGYPHDVVLENLNGVGARICRTDLDGNIIFITSETGIMVVREKA